MKTYESYESGLLDLVTFIANKRFDGHFTIMKFTGGYKSCFGTTKLSYENRENLNRIPTFKTLEESLIGTLLWFFGMSLITQMRLSYKWLKT
jgi:hypothetical protein